jgi:multidrug resistance efflux pump
MKRKIVVPLLLLLALAGAGVYYRIYARPQPMQLTGIVTTHDVLVSAQIQGLVQKLLVKEGDTVRAGQLLASIQPEELQADRSYYAHSEQSTAAQVTQAEAALRFQEAQTRDQISQAEASLASARAQVRQAEADLSQMQIDFNRAKSLRAQGIDSQQQFDQARAAYEAQQAHVQALEQEVDVQKAAVALARSNQEQNVVRRNEVAVLLRQRDAASAQTRKALVRLDYTTIQAPVAGVVALDVVRQGEVVAAGQPILSIINPDDLWIRADVEETYIDRIRLGDRFLVRFPSGMEKTGTVFYRAVDGDYATQRDVSRTKRDIKTYEIRLRVDNSDRRIWPGLTSYVILPPEVVR